MNTLDNMKASSAMIFFISQNLLFNKSKFIIRVFFIRDYLMVKGYPN
jgi:hypothetical protein